MPEMTANVNPLTKAGITFYTSLVRFANECTIIEHRCNALLIFSAFILLQLII